MKKAQVEEGTERVEKRDEQRADQAVLSIDIGYKHMALAYQQTPTSNYKIALFEVNDTADINTKMTCFKYHFDNIMLKIKPDIVVIEQQIQATINKSIEYAVSMYFVCRGIPVKLQPGQLKYKYFVCDKKNNKNQSVINLQEKHLQQLEIIYKGQTDRQVRNHRFLSAEMHQFLTENKIDKADDIGDVVLIIQAYRGQTYRQK